MAHQRDRKARSRDACPHPVANHDEGRQDEDGIDPDLSGQFGSRSSRSLDPPLPELRAERADRNWVGRYQRCHHDQPIKQESSTDQTFVRSRVDADDKVIALLDHVDGATLPVKPALVFVRLCRKGMRSLNGLIFSLAVMVMPVKTGPKSGVFLANPAQAIKVWRFFENHDRVSPL